MHEDGEPYTDAMTGKHRSTRRKSSPSVTASPTNPPRLESNPRLSPMTNCLSHGTADKSMINELEGP